MDSMARPLRVLHDDASWFARARQVRLLHVRTDAAMRKSALQVLAAMEAHADNRSAYVVLEDPWRRSDGGWEARSERMAEQWEGRRRMSAEVGIELGSLSGQRPASTDPLAGFGGWLNLIRQAVCAPLDGVVIVLAPVRVDDGAAFERELGELVRQPELSSVRWIVLELGEVPLEALRAELGAKALHSECVRDDGAFANDLSVLVRSMDPAMPGPMRAGAAWPKGVVPPRRRGAPEPTEAQREEVELELASAGASAALVGEAGARMQQHMLAAALQMKLGHGDAAIREQAEACRIADEANASRELILAWMVLAGYELALGREDEAERLYTGVVARAEAEGCHLERAQAGLALALLLARRGQHPEAATQYAESAEAALKADAVALAIECWRLAGHMAAQAKLEDRATECWQRAIELAEGSEPDVAKASSAPRAARQLAERLRARGLSAQANALEEQANRLEAGETRALMEALA